MLFVCGCIKSHVIPYTSFCSLSYFTQDNLKPSTLWLYDLLHRNLGSAEFSARRHKHKIQTTLLKLKRSLRMGKEGDLSDFKRCRCQMGWSESQKLLLLRSLLDSHLWGLQRRVTKACRGASLNGQPVDLWSTARQQGVRFALSLIRLLLWYSDGRIWHEHPAFLTNGCWWCWASLHGHSDHSCWQQVKPQIISN